MASTSQQAGGVSGAFEVQRVGIALQGSDTRSSRGVDAMFLSTPTVYGRRVRPSGPCAVSIRAGEAPTTPR